MNKSTAAVIFLATLTVIGVFVFLNFGGQAKVNKSQEGPGDVASVEKQNNASSIDLVKPPFIQDKK